MALGKKQLTYGAVLVIAAGAFVWDRVTGSGPAPAEGAAAAGSPKADATPAPAVAPTAAPAKGPGAAPQNALTMRLALGSRLASTAAARGVVPGTTLDAFAIPPDWLPKPPPAPGARPAAEEDLESGRAFAARHVLNAVMVKSTGGYAILDGDGVFVGRSVANYRLTRVTKTAALFERGNVRVEFRLDAKPAVWRVGDGSGDPAADNTGAARDE